jgi:hypothetical protein
MRLASSIAAAGAWLVGFATHGMAMGSGPHPHIGIAIPPDGAAASSLPPHAALWLMLSFAPIALLLLFLRAARRSEGD